jgi:hypothetical protein
MPRLRLLARASPLSPRIWVISRVLPGPESPHFFAQTSTLVHAKWRNPLEANTLRSA